MLAERSPQHQRHRARSPLRSGVARASRLLLSLALLLEATMVLALPEWDVQFLQALGMPSNGKKVTAGRGMPVIILRLYGTVINHSNASVDGHFTHIYTYFWLHAMPAYTLSKLHRRVRSNEHALSRLLCP